MNPKLENQLSSSNELPPWDTDQFIAELRKKVSSYHIEHPFHQAMIEGRLTRRQIQGWVANRYYYQLIIPQKDAAILANCPVRAVRRRWINRIIEHDGREGAEGGIEAWIRLGEATGLTREQITSLQELKAGVRFACDAYLNFVKQAPWQEAICSSLTEMFAHKAHLDRLNSFPKYYPWIEEEGLSYFKNRLKLVQVDVEQGLEVTIQYFTNRALQERALSILGLKLDILWEMMNAIHLAYGIGERSQPCH